MATSADQQNDAADADREFVYTGHGADPALLLGEPDLLFGLGGNVLDGRHGDGFARSGCDHESQVPRQLHQQANQEDGKGNGYHELRRPSDEFDVDGAISELERPSEVAPGVGDQHADDERGQRGAHGLRAPEPTAAATGR